ncbi:sensor histidine kinase [Planosporangium mesophilum]|uniref:histidine kinase n=1 Tax=Planosporangium mesophilum TaxID=689768 RepID=A0A8J3X0U7_9ACTN|nr:sensor histidine kinase [Planosporangium mesophilum]NJC82838.1 sensor histidine kinase [Planosporangium mesophilum]GII23692.1 two-component sensor histidine kinase [Planosporangium mesophilum]
MNRVRKAVAAVRLDAAPAALRAHPVAADAAFAALVFLVTAPRVLISPPPLALSWALQAALVLPLVWRRKAPTAVFLTIAAVAGAQWLTDRLLAADVALLISFYTVATYATARRVLLAAGVLELGAVLAAARFAPEGTKAWAWILISGMITAAGVIGTNMRTRRAYLAALEDRAARLERDRDQQAQLAVAGERARIAREMHDIVAHRISVMIALADGAGFTTRTDPDKAEEVMGRVSDTGRQALDEMRRLLGVLRDNSPQPALAPQPAVGDLDELLDTVRATGLPTRLTVTGEPFSLPSSAQLVVYRLVQEALTNVLKHADATGAEVCLNYCPGHVLQVEVTDNGRGASGTPAPGGHGLAGMRERAAVFGGTVDAGTRAGGGWRVSTRLHLQGADVLR